MVRVGRGTGARGGGGGGRRCLFHFQALAGHCGWPTGFYGPCCTLQAHRRLASCSEGAAGVGAPPKCRLTTSSRHRAGPAAGPMTMVDWAGRSGCGGKHICLSVLGVPARVLGSMLKKPATAPASQLHLLLGTALHHSFDCRTRTLQLLAQQPTASHVQQGVIWTAEEYSQAVRGLTDAGSRCLHRGLPPGSLSASGQGIPRTLASRAMLWDIAKSLLPEQLPPPPPPAAAHRPSSFAARRGPGGMAEASTSAPSQPGWGLFVGGVLLGSAVAAGAAYAAVRYGSSAAAADDLKRAASGRLERRRPGRCGRRCGW